MSNIEDILTHVIWPLINKTLDKGQLPVHFKNSSLLSYSLAVDLPWVPHTNKNSYKRNKEGTVPVSISPVIPSLFMPLAKTDTESCIPRNYVS